MLPAGLLYAVSFRDEVTRPAVVQTGAGESYIRMPESKQLPKYTGLFVNLFRAKNKKGIVDEVHGITVISPMRSGL